MSESLKEKPILLTGHNGFIGKHLNQKLNELGMKVNTLGRMDIRNTDSILNLQKCDMVVHIAAMTSISRSFENPFETYQVNSFGTLNILEYCRLKDAEKLVYISSYVYGVPKYLPIDEKHPLNPHTPYNKSKLLAENFCRVYYEDYGLKITILRPFYIYGPNQRETFLIPSILKKIKEKKKIILSDPKVKRDFLYVDDFVDVVIASMLYRKDFDIFNIGFGKSFSIAEIIEKIFKKLGKKFPVMYGGVREGEIFDMVADITKAKKNLKWKPKFNFELGLRKTIEAFNLA